MKKYIKLILILVISITMTTGCFLKNEKIPSEGEVKKYLEKKYGKNNKIISKEKYKEKDKKGYRYVVHSSNGFDFTLEAGVTYFSGYFPIIEGHYAQDYQDDFYPALIEKKKESIDKVFNTYKDISSKYEIGKYLINNSTINKALKIEIEFDNYSSLKSVNSFLYNIKDLFKDKYNIKDIDCIDIDVKSSEKYITHLKLSNLDTYSKDMHLNFLNYHFESNLYSKPKYIDKLYINGKEYVSDKYEVKFPYSPYYNEYLAEVIYGYKGINNIAGKGTIEYWDYIQQEIVTKYLNGKYEVDYEKNKTDYTIGNNKYEVYFPRDDAKLQDGYYFKKNNKKLDIKIMKRPLYYGNISYEYLRLDDWASLLECKYEIKNNALYLTSK